MRKLLCALLLACIATPAFAGDTLPFVRGSWSELRRQHADAPTVVHFWGLTCGPCLVELPQWAKLAHERPDLNLVLVAADPVVEDPADLQRFLAKAGLSAPESWGFADNFIDRLIYEIDPRWHGELPRTMLIDRTGQVKVITGVSEPQEIAAWLDAQKKG